MRIEIDPAATSTRDFYRLLTSVVIPRPIAWVSTVSERSGRGVANLAPHSFYTVACVEPPIVQFTSVGRKDTLNNVDATGEFVVCLAGEPLVDEVNASGTAYPAGVDEFAALGLEAEPSRRVSPPRVAGSPVALECVLHSTVALGDSTVVFGRVVHAAVAEGVMADDGLPDARLLAPLSRLGRDQWGTVGELMSIARLPYEPDGPPGH